MVGERGEENPLGGTKGLIEDVCETEVGMETDVAVEDVDVVSGFDEVGVSGCFRSHSVSFQIYLVVLLSVSHLDWNAAPKFVALD